DAFVAIAGPAMNAILVVAAAVGYILWVGFGSGKWLGNAPMANDDLFFNMMVFFRVGMMLNIVLALFNLVPVPPLDGSRILGSFVPAYRELFRGQAGTVIGIILFIVVFRSAGSLLYGAATTATVETLTFLENALIPGLHGPTP
ncbi:MAG: site-2 protease family protein, partial [Phycisphaerales bacterium]